MSKNNNIFNENKIKNELKNFQEGSDYSVVPTADPNVKTYNFHNDKLRSVFRNDRVPVRITQEAYDGNDYTYRGHFEEGKDYYYYCKTWTGKPPTDENGWMPISETMWKSGNGDYSKGSIRGRRLGNSPEPKKIDGHSHTPIEGQWCCGTDEVSNRRTHLEGWKKSRLEMEQQLDRAKRNNDPRDMDRVNSIIATLDQKIREHEDWLARNGSFDNKPVGCCICGFKDISLSDKDCQKCGALLCDEAKKTKSNLVQENQELRQQLSQVQKQLAEVLAELKKLKSNINGKDSEKLDQQIVRNERLIENGGSVSETEVRDQINKSEALMKEFNTTVEPIKNDKDNGLLPYLIGGSVILVSAGIIGCLLLKKKRRK